MDIDQQAADLYEANGDLTEADALALLTGGGAQGETGAKPEPSEPDAGASGKEPGDEGAVDDPAKAKDEPKDPAAAAPEVEDPATAVVLAKDGKHTISYQKLVDARETAKSEKARADALAAENAALKAAKAAAPAPAAPTAAPAPAEADPDAPLFGDYTDAELKKGVTTLVQQALAEFKAKVVDPSLTPIQTQAANTAAKDHYTAIYTAHPDADSIVESAEFAKWKDSQPSMVRAAFDATLTQGSAAEIVEMLGAYRAVNPAQTPTPTPAPAPAAPGKSAAERAKEIVAATPSKTPVSLSDVPAGSAAHHDEAAAVLDFSEEALMDRMSKMTPAAIEALLAKTL